MLQSNKSDFTEYLLTETLVREGSIWSPYKIRVLEESQKSVVADNVVTKLFNDVKTRAMKVDFSVADASKGDITRIKGYKDLQSSISNLKKIAGTADGKAKDLKEAIDEIDMSFSILHSKSREFQSGYQLNNALIRYLYASLVVGLIQGTSFAIAECVDYTRDSLNLYKPVVKPSNHIMNNSHIKSIKLFNNIQRTGQLNKLFTSTQQLTESFSAAAGAFNTIFNSITGARKWMAIISLAGIALASIRGIIFLYFDSRVKLSQYLKHLQDFVEMNASTMGTDARKVKEKQEKVAERLGKIASMISVDQNVANSRANNEIDASNKVIALGEPEPSKNDDLGIF
jgi:hypothetical protein